MNYRLLKTTTVLLALAAVLIGRDCLAGGCAVTYRDAGTGREVTVTDPDERLAGGYTHLMMAADADDCEAVEKLITLGADVNARADDGITPLWKAAQHGCVEACRMMLERGADPDAANSANETPFMVAAYNGRSEIAGMLAEHGADVLSVTNEGITALSCAASHKDVNTARLIVEKARARSEAEGRSAEEFSKSMKDYVNIADLNGFTPLMNAAYAGSVELVRMFIDMGAELNARDYRDITALTMSQVNQQPEVEKLLKEAGATE